jgi:hypothetical protein
MPSLSPIDVIVVRRSTVIPSASRCAISNRSCSSWGKITPKGNGLRPVPADLRSTWAAELAPPPQVDAAKDDPAIKHLRRQAHLAIDLECPFLHGERPRCRPGAFGRVHDPGTNPELRQNQREKEPRGPGAHNKHIGRILDHVYENKSSADNGKGYMGPMLPQLYTYFYLMINLQKV